MASYERLEFLGDSVLELAIARTLYERFPEASEGRLAKIRAHVVSRPSCAGVAKELALGELLAGRIAVPDDSTGRPQPQRPRRCSKRRSAAVYLEHGFDAVAEAVVAAFEPRIQYALHNQVDHKTELQERFARSGKSVAYQVLQAKGPPHDRVFTAAALLEGEEVGVGRGRSKKDAEQKAAKEALDRVVVDEAAEATS